MATYKSFTEIPLWNEAVSFAADIYRFCEKGNLKTDYRMKDQLRAAASSISNNIAEGFEYGSTKSFVQFLVYAKGSAGEVFNQLTILFKAEMVLKDDYLFFSNRVPDLSKKLGGLIQYLRKRNNSPIRESANPPITEGTNSSIRQSANPPIV
jgi:four helix bundle protein